jgi:hypothetical protein
MIEVKVDSSAAIAAIQRLADGVTPANPTRPRAAETRPAARIHR